MTLVVGSIVLVALVLLTLLALRFFGGLFAVADLPCALSAQDTRIAEAYMSHDSDGSDQTTVFTSADQSFYPRVTLSCPYAGVIVGASLIVVDAPGSGAEPGRVLQNLSYVLTEADASHRKRGMWFHFQNRQLWPPGKYRVDISLNGASNQSINFEVR